MGTPGKIGEVHNFCEALNDTGRKNKHSASIWSFKCLRCGKVFEKELNSVRTGMVKSCGCLAKQHGDTGTKLHDTWCNMRQRCREKSNKWYGNMGITVCEEWNDYITFKKWALENGYSEELTIDRIDPTKGYCPENCRWATPREQNLNKRNTMKIILNGNEIPLTEILWKYGLYHNNFMRDCRRSGLPVELYLVYAIGKKTGKYHRPKNASGFHNKNMIRILIQDAEALGIPTITEKKAKEMIGYWKKGDEKDGDRHQGTENDAEARHTEVPA